MSLYRNNNSKDFCSFKMWVIPYNKLLNVLRCKHNQIKAKIKNFNVIFIFHVLKPKCHQSTTNTNKLGFDIPILQEGTGSYSSDMMLWSRVEGKSPQVSTWDQVGIYCQSTAPQHICHVSHRPLRMIVPEACVCACVRKETGSSRVNYTSLSKLISSFILCANEAL